MNKKLSRLLIPIFIVIAFFLFNSTKALAANESIIHFTIGNDGNNPPKCNTSLTQCLKNEFNIVVTAGGTQKRLSDLYSTFSRLSASSKYQQLLKSSGPTIVEYQNGTYNCSGRVKPNGGGTSIMYLFNFDSCSSSSLKDRLLHESGHIIRNGHMRLFQLYESQAYYPKDGNCYNIDTRFTPSRFIKTYSTSFAVDVDVNISGSNESMADSMALYLSPQSPLSNFKTQCPKGYSWVKENIFDNYVY